MFCPPFVRLPIYEKHQNVWVCEMKGARMCQTQCNWKVQEAGYTETFELKIMEADIFHLSTHAWAGQSVWGMDDPSFSCPWESAHRVSGDDIYVKWSASLGGRLYFLSICHKKKHLTNTDVSNYSDRSAMLFICYFTRPHLILAADYSSWVKKCKRFFAPTCKKVDKCLPIQAGWGFRLAASSINLDVF